MKDPGKKIRDAEVDTSSCECIEDRIHELMDLRQSLLSDPMIRKHITVCDSCAELVVDFGALDESLSQIPLETLHRLSGLQTVDPASKKRYRLHPISFITSVACLMLVMLTSGIWFSDESQDDAPVLSEVASFESATLNSVATLDPIDLDAVVEHEMENSHLVFAPVAPHKTTPSIDLINAVSLEQFNEGVEPFQDYIGMTADLPGIRTVTKSVNVTYQIFRVISEKPPVNKSDEAASAPDVGFNRSQMQLCSV